MILANYGIVSSSGGSFDADALAFMTAASITDNTQKTAINTLVTDLKTYGIWTKMKAIYPFVGGSATSHKFNLKDPRDLDAAYRLVFSGGWTHSSTGALPNGTTGYADTKLNPLSNGMTTGNAHLAYYARTINTTTDGAEMGYYSNALTGGLVLQGKSSANQFRYFYDFYKSAYLSVTTSPIGLNVGSSVNNTRRDLYNNGVNVATNGVTDNLAMLNYNIFIGAGNIDNTSVSSYSNAECAFSSIGDGLSSTDVTFLYTAVQAFQTTLNRNV